jgi:uncharacterized protein (DUF2141 family)
MLAWLGLAPIARAATIAPACNAADPNQVRLQVSITGMHSAKGQIVISVYPDQPGHFLKGRYKLGEQYLPITQPVTHACFVVTAPGNYAVALFDDANGNDHFDLNALGIPVEGYGFSNNPKLYFGPPNLGRVLFHAHVGDNPVAVRMMYYG